MKIISIEFILGANESAEDLEDESDRYGDRRIVIKYRHPEIDFDLWTSIGPITPCRNYGEGWHQTGGNGNTPLYAIANFDPLIPWLHGGDLNVEL